MYPTILIDLIGSGLMILITFLALRYAFFLSTLDSKNFIWGFLFYFCMAMAAFSISRGVGHILKQILVLSGHKEIWKSFFPYSGGFNTTLMIYLLPSSSITTRAWLLIRRSSQRRRNCSRPIKNLKMPLVNYKK